MAFAFNPFTGEFDATAPNSSTDLAYRGNNGPFYNVTPSSMYNWRKALGGLRNNASNARILCTGDSITFGVNSGNTSALYAGSWPKRLSDLFNQSALTPSQLSFDCCQNLVNLPVGEDRFTLSGSWSSNTASYGWASEGTFFCASGWSGSSGTLTFNPSATIPINCDSFYVYLLGSASGGTVQITATGGTPTSVNVATAFPHVTSRTLVTCGSAATTNSVSLISTDSTKPIWVVGFEPVLSEKNQCLVGVSAIPGTPCEFIALSNTATLYGSTPLVVANSPSLITLLIGTNDGNALRTASQFQADLDAVVASFKTNISTADVMLITPNPCNTPATQTLLLAYQPAYRAVALKYNCSLFDIWGRYNNGTYDATLESGFHPNAVGYWDIAEAIYSILTNV